MKLNLFFFMKTISFFLFFCLLSFQSKADNSFTDSTTNTLTWDANKAFQTIRIGYSAGFKPFGASEIKIMDQSFTSVVTAEMDIYDRHGIYFEFVNQPMVHIQEEFEVINSSLQFIGYYDDFYVRSRSYSIGYMQTFNFFKTLDLSVRASLGKTYMEIKEYATNKETLAVFDLDHEVEERAISVGAKVTYWLPNNVGLSAEAAVAVHSPLYKLGLSYRIPTL